MASTGITEATATMAARVPLSGFDPSFGRLADGRTERRPENNWAAALAPLAWKSPAAESEFEAQLRRTAAVNLPVLLWGEPGSGKRIAAERLHQWSLRAHREFATVACASLSEAEQELELFGCEGRGVRTRLGRLETCHRGTVLVDELEALSEPVQLRLMRVLDDGTVWRTGGCRARRVDVRLIVTTRQHPRELVELGRLRPDLYARLGALVLRVPSVRERPQQIAALLEGSMKKVAAEHGRRPLEFPPALLHAATRYAWPGNLWEMESFALRYLIFNDVAAALSDLRAKPNGGQTEAA